ncbi:MAG: AAA family ATPase [Thermomicrobiales bacterium]
MSSGRTSLVFEQLNIRRTPGILSPYTIEGLTPGINITYGPNASGKSTTAQALQMLLWNDQPDWNRASLAGRLKVEGSDWLIDIDAGVVEVRQDGNVGGRLPVDAVNARDRYVLTLHDLLQTDNADFAGVILRESAGGYDVDSASDHLGYGIASGRPTNRTRSLKSAQQKVRQASQAQQDLAREQQNLDQLKLRREEAREAVAGVRLLERAVAARRSARKLDVARETFAAFPERISRLSGDELERLQRIDERRADYEHQKRQSEADIQQAENEIERTNLGGIKLPSGSLTILRTKAQELQDCAARLRQALTELDTLSTQRDHAARRLGRHMDEARIRVLEVDGLGHLAETGRRLERARAEYEAAEALRDWLGEAGSFEDIDRLRQGISLLNGWLRSNSAPAAASGSARALIPAIAAAGLIVVVSLGAAIVGHPLFLAAIIFAVVPVILALALKPKAVSGREAFFRQDYQRLGLERPRSWSPEQVVSLAEQLGQKVRRQQLEQERSQRWAGLENRWQQAVVNHREMRDRWTAALDEMGAASLEPAELGTITENLSRWQEADSRLAAVRQEVEREQTTHHRILQEINQRVAPAGYPPATDHTEVLGYINDLDERLRRANTAELKRDNARGSLDANILPELDRLDREREGLFASLGLESADERVLADWLDQREDFLAAQEAVREAELAHRNALAALDDHQDLIERDETELQAELDASRLREEEADRLHREIIEIETRIADAKQERDLEQAIVEAEIAGNALRDDREEAYRLAAGSTLADFVRQQTRDRDRPQVFHRARELFVRMTQGRYRLQFSDNPRPAFRATDTTTNLDHGLDELSSATRVQLLMAVRMAFVEEMEHGPKLPLILDETLGNADEHRAEAIIRAVCEICRQGRQVFYFTAQLDEVGKWRRLLQEYDGLPHQVVSLVETRKLPEYERSVLEDVEPARPAVPPPNGANRHEYRRLLHVPEINPDLGADAVHLWYLIDDPVELHHLLTLGISTWGQLHTLVEFGGEDLVSPDGFASALARSRIIDAALQARRVGRGRRVTRAAVLDSRAFTPAFLERVIRQADQANGNAERLLRRLEDGRVSRLRTDYIDAFRTYLVEEGYLDDAEPLSQAEIRARVVGEASRDIALGTIAPADVSFLLECLSLPPDPVDDTAP